MCALPALAENWVDETIEETGLVLHVPGSLLKGKGGIRNAEVAMARKVAYWVLRRRGLSISRISDIFNRRWEVIVQGLRWIDRELASLCPPAWAVDIYPLAGITFADLLWWATRHLPEDDQQNIHAFCRGGLLLERGFPVTRQVAGLRYLALHAPVRRAVVWAFASSKDMDPTGSIAWQAKKLGYRYVG